MGSLTRPQRLMPPEGGSSPEVELIQPLVLLLLGADIGPDRLLIAPDPVDEVGIGTGTSTTAGANIGDCGDAIVAKAASRNCRIQPKSCEGVISWRRATSEITTLSANASATIAILVSSDHLRRRSGPVSTSTRRDRTGVVTSLWSSLWSYRSCTMPEHHRPDLRSATWAQRIAYSSPALRRHSSLCRLSVRSNSDGFRRIRESQHEAP